MTIRSGFFNSVNGDRKYDASKFAEYFSSFIGNGVFPNPSNNLQVVSSNDMTVTVRAGRAWINGYILLNDNDHIIQLNPADGVLSRIDRIVLRYDVSDREIRLEVKQGQFASNPVAPIIQRDADAYELAIADVRVNAGAISITQANITDLRLNAELCGIVKGTVDQIDTTELFAQYQEAFEEWFEQVKGLLDDEMGTALTKEIADARGEFETLEKRLNDSDYKQESHKSNVVKHRPIYFDNNPNLANYQEGDVILQAGYGGIHDWGINRNGYWVRFESGLQLCTIAVDYSSAVDLFGGDLYPTTQRGSLWMSDAHFWFFPKEFLHSGDPTQAYYPANISGGGNNGATTSWVHISGIIRPNRMPFRVLAFEENPTLICSYNLFALGRWK